METLNQPDTNRNENDPEYDGQDDPYQQRPSGI